MPSFLSKIISFLVYRDVRSNDKLGAYPEQLHVSALPERRYLKTSRFLVILALLSISLNFALAFFYMRQASLVEGSIYAGNGTQLYQLDKFERNVRPVQPRRLSVGMQVPLTESLISEYLNLRYTVLSNEAEMQSRWSMQGPYYIYAPKLYEQAALERQETYAQLQRGFLQEIYIYSIRVIHTTLYEVYYDLFTLPWQVVNEKKCQCLEKTPECLACLRANASKIQRYKTFLRADFKGELNAREQWLQNPYNFNISSFVAYPQEIRTSDPWSDVDMIRYH